MIELLVSKFEFDTTRRVVLVPLFNCCCLMESLHTVALKTLETAQVQLLSFCKFVLKILDFFFFYWLERWVYMYCILFYILNHNKRKNQLFFVIFTYANVVVVIITFLPNYCLIAAYLKFWLRHHL